MAGFVLPPVALAERHRLACEQRAGLAQGRCGLVRPPGVAQGDLPSAARFRRWTETAVLVRVGRAAAAQPREARCS